MQLKQTLSFLSLVSVLLFITSCDTTDPFQIPPPDFSTVPPAWDYTVVEGFDIEPGLTAYILEESQNQFRVTQRDLVSVRFTLRAIGEDHGPDGEIIFSTFNNDNTSPISISVNSINLSTQIFRYSVALAYTDGFRKGIIGMREGEERTLIVQPEQGYADLPEGSVNSQYRESTLQYDIELRRLTN